MNKIIYISEEYCTPEWININYKVVIKDKKELIKGDIFLNKKGIFYKFDGKQFRKKKCKCVYRV